MICLLQKKDKTRITRINTDCDLVRIASSLHLAASMIYIDPCLSVKSVTTILPQANHCILRAFSWLFVAPILPQANTCIFCGQFVAFCGHPLCRRQKNSRFRGNPHYWQATGNYFFVEQVLIPTSGYKGQKLTRLVSRNTPPRITRINPGVPATVPLKYKKANTAASNTRIMRSAVPMFGFIIKV